MSGLILPPSMQPQASISSSIQLNDSELGKLLDGPVAWAKYHEGASMNIDAFVTAFKEKIEECGFTVEVKVYDTEQAGVYAFDAEINGRHSGSQFDPDRQVHEVTTNYLGLKGEQEGFIPTKDAAAALLERDVHKKGHKH